MPRNRRALDQASATYLEALAGALGEDRAKTSAEEVVVTFTDDEGAQTVYRYASSSVESTETVPRVDDAAVTAAERRLNKESK